MVTLLLLAACATADSTSGNAEGDTDTADTATDTADTGGGDTGNSDTGVDPATLDQDGDGYTPLEGDCDDERAHVHPGAPDACDGLDQDCDGEPIPDHSCGEEWPVDEMWTWEIHGEDGLTSLELKAGDVTGDGVTDLVASGFTTDPGTKELVFGRYGPSTVWPVMGSWGQPAWTDDFPTWKLLDHLPIVDSTGDGIGDQWVLTDSGGGYTGGAFLFPGDPGGFGTADARIDRAARAYWIDGGGVTMADDDSRGGVGDLTGDGLSEVMLYTTGSDGSSHLAYIAGNPAASGAHALGDLPQMSLDVSSSHVAGHLGGDLDGDGLADAAFEITTAEGHPTIFLSGADWADGARFEDATSWAYDGVGATIGRTSLPAALDDRPGDVDADGLDDVLINTTHPDESVCATVLSGGIPSGDVAGWTVARICTAGALGWVADVDDDGSADVHLGFGTIVPSTLIHAGGTFDVDDVSPLRPNPPGSGYAIEATADLDGDGRPEWVMDDMYFDDVRGRLLIVKGFDIPWDDPTKW